MDFHGGVLDPDHRLVRILLLPGVHEKGGGTAVNGAGCAAESE
jgi:hypothetical protein